MSTLRQITLQGYSVRVKCRRCGHVRIFSGHGLWWLFHTRYWNDQLRAVGRRLWCSRCRTLTSAKVKDPAITWVKDAPTGFLLPDPPEHEWKRMAKRYRS